MAKKDLSLLPRSTSNALLGVVIVFVGAVVWQLAAQNRALKAALEPPIPPGLAAGRTLPDVKLARNDGQVTSLSALAAEGPSVVGVMTTTCRYCEVNLVQWAQLQAELGPHIKVVLISMDDPEATEAYRIDHGIELPVWSADRLAEVKFPRTPVPATALLGHDAVVLSTKLGVLGVQDIDDMIDAARQASVLSAVR